MNCYLCTLFKALLLASNDKDYRLNITDAEEAHLLQLQVQTPAWNKTAFPFFMFRKWGGVDKNTRVILKTLLSDVQFGRIIVLLKVFSC